MSKESPERIPLAQLAGRIAKLSGGPPPSYRRCYRAVLDGRIPATKGMKEWEVSEADLPAVAKELGLTACTEPSAA